MSKVVRKIAFLTQFGLTILIPTCLLFFWGYKLDEHFGTSYLSVVLFFVGAISGGWGVWKLAVKEIGPDPKDVRNRDKLQTKKVENEGKDASDTN